jgi:hypothetical protein
MRRINFETYKFKNHVLISREEISMNSFHDSLKYIEINKALFANIILCVATHKLQFHQKYSQLEWPSDISYLKLKPTAFNPKKDISFCVSQIGLLKKHLWMHNDLLDHRIILFSLCLNERKNRPIYVISNLLTHHAYWRYLILCDATHKLISWPPSTSNRSKFKKHQKVRHDA